MVSNHISERYRELVSAQQPSAKGRRRIPKIVIDLIFTLAIPVGLLAPNLLGLGFGFADIAASIVANLQNGQAKDFERAGTVLAYVVAGLVPAIYIIIDTLRSRVFNPITTLAATSALVGGGLAFLQVDGAAFALKDSYASIVAALVMGGSLLIGRPFFTAFLHAALEPSNEAQRLGLQRLFAAPVLRRALAIATFLVFVESCAVAFINFNVNFNIVRDKFGTKTFNEQVAQANTVMRPISLTITVLDYALAFYVVQLGAARAVPGLKLLDDNFWETLEKANTPSVNSSGAATAIDG